MTIMTVHTGDAWWSATIFCLLYYLCHPTDMQIMSHLILVAHQTGRRKTRYLQKLPSEVTIAYYSNLIKI